MTITAEIPHGLGGFRPDEQAVRLLFVERSADYAALVHEALEHTGKGRFQVRHTGRLDTARAEAEAGALDAVLVDATPGAAPGDWIEEASELASRVPVIVLTGSESEDDAATTPEAASGLRDRIAASRLPDEILRAVRSHRRLGPRGGADPIVLRDPLRACAGLFARLRSSLGAPKNQKKKSASR